MVLLLFNVSIELLDNVIEFYHLLFFFCQQRGELLLQLVYGPLELELGGLVFGGGHVVLLRQSLSLSIQLFHLIKQSIQ